MAWPVDPHLYAAFLGLMAVLAATPGPANLFAVATGAGRGRRAALAGVAGMNAASLVWFGAAALGLGVIVAAWPQLFRAVAILGAGYVAWLGLKAIWAASRRAESSEDPVTAPGGRHAFVDGFAVQIANPKAVLFFTAVLPPFIDPARPVVPQLLLFAVGMVGLDALSMSAYGLGGAALSRRMTQPAFRRAFGLFSGVLLLLASLLIVSRL